jgi:hypothetical protein
MLTCDDVWDTIKDHHLLSMVNEVWTDSDQIIMISVKSARTGEYIEQLFANSSTEVMVTF